MMNPYCIKKPLIALTVIVLIGIIVLVHHYRGNKGSFTSRLRRLSGYPNLKSDEQYRSSDTEAKQFLSNPNSWPSVDHLQYNNREQGAKFRQAEDKNNPSSYHFDQLDDLTTRIDYLKRIKLSINNELRIIEREKGRLLKEKASLISKNEKLLLQIGKSKLHLKQLELDISANRRRKFEQTCDISRIAPILFNPLKSVDLEQMSTKLPDIVENNSTITNHSRIAPEHSQDYMFDLSICPLSREFKFHVLEQGQNPTNETYDLKIELSEAVDILQAHRQHTQNVSEACLVVIFLTPNSSMVDIDTVHSNRNKLLINLVNSETAPTPSDRPARNMAIASSNFKQNHFRDRFDLVLPSIWRPAPLFDSIVGSIPPQSPIERKYLASYFGQGKSLDRSAERSSLDGDPVPTHELNTMERILQSIHRNSIDDLFLFIYNCGLDVNTQCYEEKEKMIELSTFLIILPIEHDINGQSSDLIYLALSRGAVPVVVGGRERVRLPFDEVIDWRRAAVLIHAARLPEIHFILRSLDSADIYQLKYHGRHIFENYLATAKQIIGSVISTMSIERFSYPPPPIQDIKTVAYFSDKNLTFDSNCTSLACQETKSDATTSLISSEILGPREGPLVSKFYRRNYSLALTSTYDLWNNPFHSPFHLFPNLPIDPIPPSEYKFYNPGEGYRPIGGGLGGSGREFSRALGGDFPNEQYTIVLLTYERETILMKTLERLKGLPHLNKILIIWNGVNYKPSKDIIWPDVGVPIQVVKVGRNSLNNRFLPYDAIETDAILSLDDDSPLRPDELTFAFRIWRQSRDKIVGFPGRYHAWDSNQNTWVYNSNHSCELSMVLTGGAFFHKYYTYMYTYQMPEVIRSIVDKFMNCEDIAMNFLVAHLTRQPPIKVTSRWTFHCAGCPSSLSEDDSHFRERHECLNTFASIYGYMPLLSTQHRSDSVLFKTKLPQDKQKCFRFV